MVSVLGPFEGSMEQSALIEEGRARVGALRAVGVQPGHKVAIAASSSLEFLKSCMTVWYAGATVMPLPVPTTAGLRARSWAKDTSDLLRRLRVDAFLVNRTHPAVPDASVRVVEYESLAVGPPVAADVDADSAALIQFTSGTTSRARPVVITHGTLASYLVAHTAKSHEHAGDDDLLTWLPLYHDMGLIAHTLIALTVGMTLTLIDTKLFIEDPRLWLTESSARRSTVLGAPNFAYGLLARWVSKGLRSDLDLSPVRLLGSGGEPIDVRTTREALRILGGIGLDPLSFTPAFGLAEATCAATIGTEGLKVDRVDRERLADGHATVTTDAEGAVEIASLGSPLPGLEMKIDGRSGERQVGEVLLSGPTLMSGYLDDPEATRAALEGGWLRTGDLGYVVGGELHLVGRAKDTIIVRGQNYFPEDIERIAAAVDGVRPGRCAAVGVSTGETEEIAIMVETNLTSEEEKSLCREAVTRRVWEETGVSPRHVIFVTNGTVPKTSSGKLQRARVRSMVRELVAN